MNLLTDELRLNFPSIGSTDNSNPEDIPVVAKYFNPVGSGTWYAVEFDGTDLFFGLANIHVAELGYFLLSELEELRLGPGGIFRIERDLHVGQITLLDAMQREGMTPWPENLPDHSQSEDS